MLHYVHRLVSNFVAASAGNEVDESESEPKLRAVSHKTKTVSWKDAEKASESWGERHARLLISAGSLLQAVPFRLAHIVIQSTVYVKLLILTFLYLRMETGSGLEYMAHGRHASHGPGGGGFSICHTDAIFVHASFTVCVCCVLPGDSAEA